MEIWSRSSLCKVEERIDKVYGEESVASMFFDTIIQNGLVVDGSGAAGFKADIGITDQFITALGDLSQAESAEVVNAEGQVVCPGFIDVHVHSELALLGGMDRSAPLQMGVTTQLMGPDGFSWAPLQGQKLIDMKNYFRTFYDHSAIESEKGFTIEQLLNRWRGHIPSNVALQVPHASVRLAVMGWDARIATNDELNQMEVITRHWLEAGAKAFATGLEYEPMRHADRRELVRLSQVTAEYGGSYVTHQRGYGDNVSIGCNETFSIGKEAGIPVHISHFTVDDTAEELIRQAEDSGIDVSFDMYPYPAGCTSLLFMLPNSVQAGSVEDVRRRIESKAGRQQCAAHLESALPVDRVRFAAIGIPETGWEGKSVAEVQRELGKTLVDMVCDILLESNFQTLMIYHWPQDRYHFLEKTYKHERHMVATDGVYVGKKPHPRGFGTFPKVIREFVYEKGWLSLEQAIYKMSGYPAKRFNLHKRGVLAVGNYADIVMYDPTTLKDGATFLEPRTPNIGLEVWVNGQQVIRSGKPIEGNHGLII
jgi:N-acyl-D-amino-acid deacylase